MIGAFKIDGVFEETKGHGVYINMYGRNVQFEYAQRVDETFGAHVTTISGPKPTCGPYAETSPALPSRAAAVAWIFARLFDDAPLPQDTK